MVPADRRDGRSADDAGRETAGGQRAVKRFGISKRQRIRSSLDFERIFAGKQRVGDPFLLIFAAENEVDVTRFGLSVSRKHGNAMKRNRLKRLLREAFRLSQHDMPAGLDLVLIPRQNAVATLDDYCRALIQLTWRLAKRLERTGQQSDD